MHIAAKIPQPDGADGNFLDQPGLVVHAHHIADPELILRQDEHARDHVLDQCLRPEPDRETDNPGPRQQRADIHADFR